MLAYTFCKKYFKCKYKILIFIMYFNYSIQNRELHFFLFYKENTRHHLAFIMPKVK